MHSCSLNPQITVSWPLLVIKNNKRQKVCQKRWEEQQAASGKGGRAGAKQGVVAKPLTIALGGRSRRISVRLRPVKTTQGTLEQLGLQGETLSQN